MNRIIQTKNEEGVNIFLIPLFANSSINPANGCRVQSNGSSTEAIGYFQPPPVRMDDEEEISRGSVKKRRRKKSNPREKQAKNEVVVRKKGAGKVVEQAGIDRDYLEALGDRNYLHPGYSAGT